MYNRIRKAAVSSPVFKGGALMKKYRAAVIGLGFIGPHHIDALRRVPQAEIAALCDQDPAALRLHAQRQGVPAVSDWREIIADPKIDVIHNCLPPGLHDEVNRAALLAGKHLYCEKPLSLTAAAAREIAQLAEKQGVRAALNHQYRMNAAVQEMRARVQKGLAGRVLAVTGCYLQESAVRDVDWSSRMANTGIARALSDIGTHWADTACCVLGQPIAKVMADLHIHHPVRTDSEGKAHAMDTEDTGFILVRFAGGTPGQLTVTKSAAGHKNDLRISVWGDQYSLDWDQEQPDRLLRGIQGVGFETVYMNPRTCQEEARPFVTAPMGHVMGWPDALRNAVQAFYDSLADPGAPAAYATLRDGFAHMAFVEACVKSSREKRWAEVEAW